MSYRKGSKEEDVMVTIEIDIDRNKSPKPLSPLAKCFIGIFIFSIVIVPAGHFYLHFFTDYIVSERCLMGSFHRDSKDRGFYSLLLVKTRSAKQCAVLSVCLPDADGTVSGNGIAPQYSWEPRVNYCGYTVDYKYTRTAKMCELDTPLHYGKVYFIQRKPFIEKSYGKTMVTDKLQVVAERSFGELGITVDTLSQIKYQKGYKTELLETDNIKSIVKELMK